MELITRAILGTTMFLILFSGLYVLQDKEPRINTNYDSPIKLAYPLYDAPYSKSDYKWVSDVASLIISFESVSDDVQYLKGLNPDIIALQYKFSGVTDEEDIGHSLSGYESIPRDWFLRSIDGAKVYDDYNEFSRSHSFFLDLGKQAIREYAANDYIESLTDWDGIFLDVVYLDLDQFMPQNVDYDKILYEMNMKKYLVYLTARLNSENKLLVVNGATFINRDPPQMWAGQDIKSLWLEVLSITDGAAEEAFVNLYHWRPNLVWQSLDRWEQQLKALEASYKLNKIYIAIAHNRGMNRQDTIYNVASFLLGVHENSYFLNLGVKGYRLANYKADYEFYKDIYNIGLGQPQGKRYFSSGTWNRNFEGGVVSVDIDKHTAQIRLHDGSVIK